MILYFVRRADEAGTPFNLSNSYEIFSKHEDAERRLKTVNDNSLYKYFTHKIDCPSVYSDDLELQPQCVLEIKNKYCFYHDVTDKFHGHHHHLVLDKEGKLTESERQRVREYARTFFPGLGDILKHRYAVYSEGYEPEAIALLTLLEEFNKHQQ